MSKCLKAGIHDLLEYDGPIMLDSGGYQTLIGKRIRYTARELGRFAEDCDFDYVLALDKPPRRTKGPFRKLADMNHRHYEEMSNCSVEVIPIVHAPLKLAELELDYLSNHNFRYLAIGGLVYSLRGAIAMSMKTIDYVVNKIRNRKLHVLGFGGPNLCKLLPKDIHSTDFGGWRTAAANGYLMLPSGYRKITRKNVRGHAPKPNSRELSFINETCSILGVNKHNLATRFEARALFNAYVVTKRSWNL